jgi:hypothetical protein
MLTDERIQAMPNHEYYWQASGREEQADLRRELRALALTPSHLLPLYTIGDYEKARKGQSVPIEQPKPVLPGSIQITDNRTMSQYIRDTELAPAPALTISQYLEGIGDPAPLYMYCPK